MEQPLSKIQYSLRGNLLAATVEIERKMDEYISGYFCDDVKKKSELCEMLLYTERINLDLKTQILDMILGEDTPIGLITNLRAIVKARNVFAHLELDSDKSTHESITFKKYVKGKLKPVNYSIDALNLISKQVADTNKELDLLINR